MFSGRETPANKLHYLRLLEAVSSPAFPREVIEDNLTVDPSLIISSSAT